MKWSIKSSSQPGLQSVKGILHPQYFYELQGHISVKSVLCFFQPSVIPKILKSVLILLLHIFFIWLRLWMFLPHEAGIFSKDLSCSCLHFSCRWKGESKADRSTVNCSGLCDCCLLLGKLREEWGEEWWLFSFFANCLSDNFGQMRNHFQMGEQRWEVELVLLTCWKLTLCAVLIALWYSQTFWILLNLVTQQSPLRYIMDTCSVSPPFMRQM